MILAHTLSAEAALLAVLVVKYQGLVFLLLTLVYTGASIVILLYSRRANRLAEASIAEMAAERIQEERPHLGFEVRIDVRHVLSFVIFNAGRTAARRVQLTLDQGDAIADLVYRDNERVPLYLRELAIFEPLQTIVPHGIYQEIVCMDSARFWKANEDTRRLTGRLDYADDTGNAYTFPIDIDLHSYFERAFAVVPTVDTVRQDIERFCQALTRSLDRASR